MNILSYENMRNDFVFFILEAVCPDVVMKLG